MSRKPLSRSSMNSDFYVFGTACAGSRRPTPGRSTPAVAVLFALLLAGCGEDESQRTLPSIQLAIAPSVAPFYDDGELALYEVRRLVPLPILAPTESQRAALETEPPPPFVRNPWITLDDVRVQLSWTLTNLDDEPRRVEVLIDPWNEFARYSPGLMIVDAQDGEAIPNLSGIDFLYRLEGKGSGASSRRHGTFTFDDMDELARDFATVMNLAENPPPALGSEEGDGALLYANHAFSVENHSTRDPLVQAWIPSVIPALTGFDLGLRTEEPATVAIEVVVEVVDLGSNRVQSDGDDGRLLEAPEEIISFGAAP
ncbi:MAG TPA: hypothetical protein VIM73_09300 [Polyangiaceae bacterium]